MFFSRRRTRDAAWAETLPRDRLHPSVPKKSQFSNTAVVLASFLSTLAIALVLLARFHSSETPAVALATPIVQDYGRFTLHPEDHIFRPATTIKQTWRITSGTRRPDGVLKRVYLINDAFPGPTLEVRSGDRLVINVQNELEEDEEVLIHWHGLSMRGANNMDGAASITQAPIESGRSFVYDFTIDSNQHGTFWYHSHFGTQRADGLYGGLVVHKPSESDSKGAVGAEHFLTMGDWYHRTAEEALDFYAHSGSFANEAVPDSVLLNGQGVFDCNSTVPARPVDCEQLTADNVVSLKLDGTKDNVLRVVNVGAYAGIAITVANSVLTVLSVDGGNEVEHRKAKTVQYIQPGERLNLLVQALAYDEDTHIKMSLDDRPFKMSNPALAKTQYLPASWTSRPDRLANMLEQKDEVFDLGGLKSSTDQSTILPEKADQTIVLYAKTQILSHLHNVPHGFINQTYWKPQESPPEPLIALHRDQWDDHQLVPSIPYVPSKPLWVDVVLNNLDEEAHPFHLHGYDFWVLAGHTSMASWGSYNPFEDLQPPGGQYDLVHAIKKDTVSVPRRGYVVLRFRADNPV